MDRKKVWEIRSGKVQAWLETAALAAGSALFGGLVLLLAFCGEYPERLADNRYLILMGLMCGLGGGALYYFWSHKEWKWHVKRPAFWMAAGYLLIFALQVFWVSKVYFYMGWDVNMLQYRVEAIVNGGSMAETSADFGYSIYPNNLLLFYVFCIIEKIAMLFSMEEPFHLCIYISCLCVNLACFLGHLMVRRLTGPFMQGCYMVVCLPFILFSPWIMSPYSDTYGMFFVALGMWALTCLDRKYLKWIVAGVSSHNRLSCKADLYFCAVCGLAGVRNPVTAFPAGKVEGAGGSGVQYGGVLVHGSVHSPVDSAHLQFPADAGVRDALHPFPDDGFQ